MAAVTIPVNERGDVLVTQRAFRGVYNGMWVFPGGHVDRGEGLYAAGVREVLEETGIEVDSRTLKPLAVWEGTVSSLRKQFCVIFFSADATCNSAFECTMQLQFKEVRRLSPLVPFHHIATPSLLHRFPHPSVASRPALPAAC
jgi:8-oxo-dGTP pyrophosphatase MutT (NUDIX family)